MKSFLRQKNNDVQVLTTHNPRVTQIKKRIFFCQDESSSNDTSNWEPPNTDLSSGVHVLYPLRVSSISHIIIVYQFFLHNRRTENHHQESVFPSIICLLMKSEGPMKTTVQNLISSSDVWLNCTTSNSPILILAEASKHQTF